MKTKMNAERIEQLVDSAIVKDSKRLPDQPLEPPAMLMEKFLSQPIVAENFSPTNSSTVMSTLNIFIFSTALLSLSVGIYFFLSSSESTTAPVNNIVPNPNSTLTIMPVDSQAPPPAQVAKESTVDSTRRRTNKDSTTTTPSSPAFEDNLLVPPGSPKRYVTDSTRIPIRQRGK